MMESKAVPLQFSPPHKTKEWMQSMVSSIAQMAASSADGKERDLLCQRYFDGKVNESDFDYLRKIDDYEMPARVRHIPIVRQNINHLVSQEIRRTFNFRAYAIDEESLKRRLSKKASDYIAVIDNNIQQKHIAIQAQTQQLDQQRQQIDLLLQREPKSQEEAQQQQALQKIYPQLVSQIELGKKSLEREIYISKEEIEKIEKYYKYNFNDFVEMKGNSLLKFAHRSTEVGLKFQMKNGMQDRLVTGKELYLVDLIDGHKFPIFKRLHPYNVYWSGDGENEWVQDGQWVAINYKMSPTAVIDWFGAHLTPTQKAEIDTYQTMIHYGQMRTSMNSGAVFNDPGDADLYGGTKLNQGLDVWWTYWKSSRRIRIKHTPNKYIPGKYHRHFIDEDEHLDADVKVNEEKGEFIVDRYVDDVYEGVQIGRNIFVNLGRRKIQLRNDVDLTVKLPVFGLSFNGVDNPYSLIWATKDIQELSNIVHYHRELMLALAGVKGIVMDLAQKPDDLTEKEWLYFRKQGITFINSLQRRNGRFPSFNQFTTYDDTLSSSIQYLDNLLVSLQKLVDEITGVSYQRKGQTVASDQVGTTQSAINQSILTTEVLFYEHDETVRRALEEWLNLAKASLEEGHVFSYEGEDGSHDVVTIPANIFKSTRFRMGVQISLKEEQGLQELRQIAMQGYARGQIALDNLVKVYNIDNLKELEKTVIHYAEKAAANAQMYEQNKIQAEAQAVMDKVKFEKEYDKIVADQQNQLKQVELQLKQAELEIKNRELNLKEFVEKNKLMLQDKEIATEREVEMNYLAEQNRANRVDEILRTIQLQLDGILQGKQIELGHIEKMKGLAVQERKAKQDNKEKIKD